MEERRHSTSPQRTWTSRPLLWSIQLKSLTAGRSIISRNARGMFTVHVVNSRPPTKLRIQRNGIACQIAARDFGNSTFVKNRTLHVLICWLGPLGQVVHPFASILCRRCSSKSPRLTFSSEVMVCEFPCFGFDTVKWLVCQHSHEAFRW